jgi:hypothetical protein
MSDLRLSVQQHIGHEVHQIPILSSNRCDGSARPAVARRDFAENERESTQHAVIDHSAQTFRTCLLGEHGGAQDLVGTDRLRG